MSANSILLPLVQTDSRPFNQRLHEWVTTVDHKRLGVLYVLYAMGFLLVGGVEALIMRLQLIRPHMTSFLPKFSTVCSRCTGPP